MESGAEGPEVLCRWRSLGPEGLSGHGSGHFPGKECGGNPAPVHGGDHRCRLAYDHEPVGDETVQGMPYADAAAAAGDLPAVVSLPLLELGHRAIEPGGPLFGLATHEDVGSSTAE